MLLPSLARLKNPFVHIRFDVALLLDVALLRYCRLLKARAQQMRGSVVLLFQPAEEGGAGADAMIKDGALKGVGAVSGLHVWPSLPSGEAGDNNHFPPQTWPGGGKNYRRRGRCRVIAAKLFTAHAEAPFIFALSLTTSCRILRHIQNHPMVAEGTISTRAGTIMAASDRFEVTIVGRGGHGAMPHLAVDPVVAASAVVMALQAVVSRETSPTDSAVLTVARFNTGEGAFNVIPHAVRLAGTMRAVSDDTMQRLRRRVEEVMVGTAATYGCAVEGLHFSQRPYSATVNDEQLAAVVRGIATEAAVAAASDGAASVSNGDADDSAGSSVKFEWASEPSMAAEDFSFYSKAVPSVFSFLGIGDPVAGTNASLHSPRFAMDERQMPLGAALHAAVALRLLEDISNRSLQSQHHDDL